MSCSIPTAAFLPSLDDGVMVFESGAILVYLAEKTGRFLPREIEQAVKAAPKMLA